jgi:23S rRNA pseudouridine2605 synthase
MKIRLQRFMADCGVASRRECEAMIEAGRVRVNGQTRTDMPVLIDPAKDIVTVDEEKIGPDDARAGGLKEQEKVYFLLNKPKGILVTNFDPSDRKTVGELMAGVKERVFPVGRLDMDARGALIMTNDGELANRLTHPRYGVEKTYIVEVDGRVGHDDLEKIKRGMYIGPDKRNPNDRGRRTERFKVKLLGRERGRTILELTISEGKNREIRRVMAWIGHVVRDLNRVAIAGKVTIKGLEIGKYRPLTDKEVKWLYHASSKEFHDEQRNATQAWYEAKEMEKERKRLEREQAEAAAKPVQRSAEERQEKRWKEFQDRPARKGKKPFVPPSGRNAGKALGGNFIGRKRAEREAAQSPAAHIEKLKREVRTSHPLGDAAQTDE